MKRHLHRPQAGFSLLEIIVVVAIMTVVAGAAVPLAATALAREARNQTRAELGMLASACLELARDTGQLPSAASALSTDNGASGWSGPYISSLETDTRSQRPAHEVDGWSRAYRFQISGSQLAIDSAGTDGVFGNADDLGVRVDAAVVWREETLGELKVLNQAVLNYNAIYQSTDPLPGDWAGALSRLVVRGFLPSAAGYDQDAYGTAYTGNPAGVAPLVQVISPNIGAP